MAALTPLYGFLALKFNANAVLLPLWPWATFAFKRSLEHRRIRDGILMRKIENPGSSFRRYRCGEPPNRHNGVLNL